MAKGATMTTKGNRAGPTLRRAACCALATALAPQAGLAQEDTDAFALDPIVVESESGYDAALSGGEGHVATSTTTGAKAGADLLAIPQSITVITEDEIGDRSPQQVEEVLAYTAGVTASPWGIDNRFDQFTIRGFDIGPYGIYRDGLQQKAVSFSGFTIDPFMIQRIDVLRGPASVLYGENDAAGMINVITKRPQFETGGEVFASLGSQSTVSAGVDYGGPLNEAGTLAYRLVALGRDGETEIEDGPDNRLLFAPALTWAPGAATAVTFLGHLQRDSLTPNAFLPVAGEDYDAALGDLPESFVESQSDFNRFDTDQASFGYQASHEFGSALTLRQNFRYAAEDTDYRHFYYGGMADADTMSYTAFTVDEDATSLGLDTQLQYDSGFSSGENTLLVGLDLGRQTVDGENGFDPSYLIDISDPSYDFDVTDPAIYQDRKQRLDQAGLYLQNMTHFDSGLNVNLGLRQSWSSNNFHDRLAGTDTTEDYDALTKMIGVTYELANGIAPYASYGESFTGNSGTDAEGNLLEPTRGEQYEVGVKFRPTGFDGFFTAALFDITKKDMLTPDLANPAFSIQTGEVRHRGAELEARADLVNGLSFVASYTWLDAEITSSNAGDEGNVPSLVPEHQGALWADYSFSQGRLDGLNLGAGVRYVGETWGDNANTREVDDYVVADLAARYDFGAYQANLTVTNAFDNDYFSTCDATVGCIRSEGRQFTATLTRSF
jgi:iron complex outermembrane recepter protein